MTKTLRLDQLFAIAYGNKLDMNKMQQDPDGIAFVGRRGTHQGVSGHVRCLDNIPPYPAGLLTVALGGAVLATFVQQEPFYTAQNVAVLSPINRGMSLNERLYYATCIKWNDFRYLAFGREANRTLGSIEVPAEPPAWVYEVPEPGLATLNFRSIFSKDDIPSPRPAAGFPRRVDELFHIRYGHSLELNRLTKVEAPQGVDFVGRAAVNNGVTARVLAPSGIEPGSAGEITVALSGQGGCMAAFVQPSAFVCGFHVAILSPIDECMTLGEKLWWCTCLWANHYRYGFGRQANRTLASLLLPPYLPTYVYESLTALVSDE
jgi:hypothetical protein